MKKIIMISGAQGSGKTTLALDLGVLLPHAKLFKFAGPLYTMHDKIYEVLARHGMESSKIDGTLLQFLGEHLRQVFNEDIWVNIMRHAIESYVHWPDNVVVIDDLRYPNEVGVWDRNECLLVRLECPEEVRKQRAQKWRPFVTHPSEIALNDFNDWDLKIDTSGAFVPFENARKVLNALTS